MQWSKLFLIESKYKVVIKPSKIAWQTRYIVVGLFMLMMAFISNLLYSNIPLWQLSALSLLMIPCLLIIIPAFTAPFFGLSAIILTHDGQIVTAADSHFLITPKSKLYPWGCVLVLAKQQPVELNSDLFVSDMFVSDGVAAEPLTAEQGKWAKENSRHIVFKDNVQQSDFRRLARLVNNARC